MEAAATEGNAAPRPRRATRPGAARRPLGREAGARKIRDWEVKAMGCVAPLLDAAARRGGRVGGGLVGYSLTGFR